MSSFFRARTIRSSTIPISDGIGSLAAILRRVDVDTTRFHIRIVEDFSRRFNCTPDRLGPRGAPGLPERLVYKKTQS